MEQPATPDRRQKRRRGQRHEQGQEQGQEQGHEQGHDQGHQPTDAPSPAVRPVPAVPGATGPADPCGGSWGEFQDRLDDAVGALGDGRRLEVRSASAPWRIRIQAGWPGVEGPGTLAYHLQLGSDLGGTFGPWASTPYARSLGFAATRVAGAVAALGVMSDATGLANPSMISSGSVGALEMSDLTVELLREAFGVLDVAEVTVVDPDADDGGIATRPAPRPAAAGSGTEQWWSGLDFRPAPEVTPGGDHVVGWVGNILVELSRDTESLPGLLVTVARARLTDPAADPLPGPSSGVAGLLGRLRVAGTEGVTVDSVTGRDHLVHAWAHRMVVADPAELADGTDEAAADAAAQVIRFVRAARRANPDVSRPSRGIIRMGD